MTILSCTKDITMVYLVVSVVNSLNLFTYEAIPYLTFPPIRLDGDALLRVHVSAV